MVKMDYLDYINGAERAVPPRPEKKWLPGRSHLLNEFEDTDFCAGFCMYTAEIFGLLHAELSCHSLSETLITCVSFTTFHSEVFGMWKLPLWNSIFVWCIQINCVRKKIVPKVCSAVCALRKDHIKSTTAVDLATFKVTVL